MSAPPPDVAGADGGSDTSCNACLEGCCGDSWCACAADSGLDDAGAYTGCLGLIQCVQTCIAAGDAGTPTQCFQTCAAAYPQNQQAEANTLFTCIAGSCGTATTCGQ